MLQRKYSRVSGKMFLTTLYHVWADIIGSIAFVKELGKLCDAHGRVNCHHQSKRWYKSDQSQSDIAAPIARVS